LTVAIVVGRLETVLYLMRQHGLVGQSP
jgi:hypothetical protein